MDDRDPRNGICGSTYHEEDDNDILGMLSTPFEVRIRQQVCNSFLVHVRNSLPFQSTTVSSAPKCVTALTSKFNGKIPNTKNRYPLRLLLEIEEAIRVNAKRPLGPPRPTEGYLSCPWPGHRNRIPGRTGREGEGRDGRADYLGELVKRRLQDGREFTFPTDAYGIPTTALGNHFSLPIRNQRTALRPSHQRSTRCRPIHRSRTQKGCRIYFQTWVIRFRL